MRKFKISIHLFFVGIRCGYSNKFFHDKWDENGRGTIAQFRNPIWRDWNLKSTADTASISLFPNFPPPTRTNFLFLPGRPRIKETDRHLILWCVNKKERGERKGNLILFSSRSYVRRKWRKREIRGGIGSLSFPLDPVFIASRSMRNIFISHFFSPLLTSNRGGMSGEKKLFSFFVCLSAQSQTLGSSPIFIGSSQDFSFWETRKNYIYILVEAPLQFYSQKLNQNRKYYYFVPSPGRSDWWAPAPSLRSFAGLPSSGCRTSPWSSSIPSPTSSPSPRKPKERTHKHSQGI